MIRSLMSAAALTVAALFSATASAQTLGCELGGTGGLIPATGTGGGGVYPTTLPPSPGIFTLNVVSIPAGATCVTEVKLNGLAHTYSDDVQFVLEDPSGAKVNLWCLPGASCDFSNANLYSVIPGVGTCATFPACGPTPIVSGAYPQTFGDAGQVWPSGTNGITNNDLTTVAPQLGTWKLYAYDWFAADTGALGSWDLCFGTPPAPIPPCAVPTLVAPANAANVFGPVVNLSWNPVQGATSYDVDVDGIVTNVVTSSFNYNSTAGGHTWTVRAVNAVGATAYAAPRTFTDLGPAPTPCGTGLQTLFASNNNGSVGGIVFFDINVLNPAGINLAQLQTNTGALAVGSLFGTTIYMKSGTSVGFETNAGAWTQMAVGAGIAMGANQPSLVEFPDFMVAPGVWGVALVQSGAAHYYTNGTGANQFYSNADLSITLGKAQNVPFSGTPFSPRVWNGAIRYNCGAPPPVSYCTAGTSSSGCAALITADNQPSVSQANPCNLTVSSVEGQKSGLIFYGLTQAAIPWATGSTSFLCVKSPTQRTATQSSNGTAGLCDGSLVLDLNNYITTHPGSLGQPFAAGNKIYAQAWYRDPPAPKTTNLSDGIELTFQP
jgi:hypothetical protein